MTEIAKHPSRIETTSPSEMFPGSAPTRRTLLKAGAAAVALGGVRLRWPAPAHAQQATPATSNEVCVLTPELTEGPYYVDEALIRSDLTEGKEGLPLTLRITVNDPTACAPLANAAVDVRHCDALGYYWGWRATTPAATSTRRSPPRRPRATSAAASN